MKYAPEPLDCPVCHKPPTMFKRWDDSTGEWSDGWHLACKCTPDNYAYGEDKVEVVASWNKKVDEYDPKFEEHRYRDQDDIRDILEDMKKFKKALKENPDEWCN
jgi:hypothetical protein